MNDLYYVMAAVQCSDQDIKVHVFARAHIVYVSCARHNRPPTNAESHVESSDVESIHVERINVESIHVERSHAESCHDESTL